MYDRKISRHDAKLAKKDLRALASLCETLPGRVMLKSILMVTITAPDLSVIEQAYHEFLDYRVAERSKISAGLAKAWGAPATAGRDCILMQPESGEKVYLRFVQSEPIEGYAPLRTFGWNCTEILVQDVDDLARRLADSPFKIIGQPRNLSSDENIRAMQVLGPANEVLYLTRIGPRESEVNLGAAQTYVDRVFIVVLGGSDLQAMLNFYVDSLKMSVTKPTGVRISVLSKAHGLDPEMRHQLALVKFPSRFLIEVDQYPKGATNRSRREGDLPPGIAMVSLEVETLDDVGLGFFEPPQELDEFPYDGRRVGVTGGATGEMIELVETRQFT